MNELLNFEQYVRENLSDRVAARALIDFREQLLGQPHRANVRAVAAIRHRQRNSDNLAAAARLVGAASWVRGPLFSEMLSECGEDPDGCSASVIILPGSRPPFIQATGYPGNGEMPHHTLVVGARWLIVAARLESFRRDAANHNFGGAYRDANP